MNFEKTDSPIGYCEICNRKLVPIGKGRKGEKLHNDWSFRTMHKKCWIDAGCPKNKINGKTNKFIQV